MRPLLRPEESYGPPPEQGVAPSWERTGEAEKGPYIQDAGDSKILHFPDGSAAIEEKVVPRSRKTHGHFRNLAEVLDEAELRQIGFELKNAIEEDQQSQESYLTALANVIGLLGLNLEGSDKKEDLPFDGASQICSTALFESLLDMVATVTSSLFPAMGMVDCVITGETTRELEDTAYRKKTWFNLYLTQIALEFKKEGRKAFLWAILAGSCYKKVYIDPVLQRPTSQFLRPEDFIVNSQYATHLSAPRKTQILRLTGKEIKLRILDGMYRDPAMGLSPNPNPDEVGEIQEALNEISGHDDDHQNVRLDKEYVLYETHVEYFVHGDKEAPQEYELPMPYIITVDEQTGFVYSVIRNWEKDDIRKKKKEYFVNYSLFPALEGEGYGLLHYAGQLAKSATAIKRQLINTGMYSNFPGGMYAAGIRLENNNLRPAPGEFIPVQTGGTPIDQVISSLPYKEPSPALGQLLQSIEESIKKPSAIINSKVAEMTPQAAATSVLAMLDSLHKVPNSILEGFHEAFWQELMLFNSRFKEWIPEGSNYPFKVPGGEHLLMREDFEEDVRVIPASNPALQNSSYRLMQAEVILNQARQGADLHDMRYAYKYFYENLGLSPEDVKNLLPPPPEDPPPPFSGDPVTENTFLMTKKSIRALLPQDHEAHMMVHKLILLNPGLDPEVGGATKAHIQEHESMQFFVNMQAHLGIELPENPTEIPSEAQNQIAVAAAQVAQQQMAAMQAQQQPAQQPLDPSMAAIQIEEIRTNQRRESEGNKLEIEKMKLALQEAKFKTELSIAEMKVQQEQDKELRKQEIEKLKIYQAKESELLKLQLEEKKIDADIIRNQKAALETPRQMEEPQVLNEI